MTTMRRTMTHTTMAAGLLLALSVAPSSAQWREAEKPAPGSGNSVQSETVKGAGRWSELRLVVKDLDSGEEMGSIEPYGRVRLPEKAKVRLIMSAYVPGNDKPIYPETVYSEGEPGRGGFRITKASRENANVTLQLVEIKEAHGQRSERVSWQILDDRVPSKKQSGSFVIDVVADAPHHGQEASEGRPGRDGGPNGRPPSGTLTRQAQMTRVLYRAILMREPDEGAQGFTDRIARDGYEGLVRAAIGIAESNESRIQLYQDRPDLTPEQRLRTLYRELLGMDDPERSSRDAWEEDLRRVRDRKIAPVVEEMVRSRKFRELYSW